MKTNAQSAGTQIRRLAHRVDQSLVRRVPFLTRAPADDLTVELRRAQTAITQEKWHEAVDRYQLILRRFGEDAPAQAYSGLGAAYVEQDNLDLASAVIQFGRNRFPHDEKLALQWAQLPAVSGEWFTAIDRLKTLHDDFGDRAPPRLHARLAVAHWRVGDLESALHLIDHARERFPDTLELELIWAQFPTAEGDWSGAASRMEKVLRDLGDTTPAKLYLAMAAAYWEAGDLSATARVVDMGRKKFPKDPRLARQWAQLAMINGDWEATLTGWQEVIDLGEQEFEHANEAALNSDIYRLPADGPRLDWDGTAWIMLAREWSSNHAYRRLDLSSSLHLAVAHVLELLGATEEAHNVLRLGLQAHPENLRLRFALRRCEIDRDKNRPGSVTRYRANAIDCEANLGVRDRLRSTLHRMTIGRRGASQLSNDCVLDQFRPPHSAGPLGSLHLIRFARGSSIELELRSGRYFTRRTMLDRIRGLSEAEEWPEITEEGGRLRTQAKQVAAKFSDRFARPPHLPSETLFEAIYSMIYMELCVFEPIRRLAQALAKEPTDEPVFIEIESTTISYLGGFNETDCWQVYLSVELRRRGVNAFLCYADAEQLGEAEALPPDTSVSRHELSFVPHPILFQHRQAKAQPVSSQGDTAIVPAGIRSVNEVIANLSSPIVYSSGSIIREFAYDRAHRESAELQPDRSLHPDRGSLRTINLGLWPAAVLQGVLLTHERRPPVFAQVELSQPLDGDWLTLLDRLLGDYLEAMARAAHSDVALLGIRQAHVCDHLFPDSALLASAVKASGGRVDLWPHSTNPVHADVRRRSSFDLVHAVTRSGAREWRQRFPETEVIHTPHLMFRDLGNNAIIDEAEALSIVVIGGKHVLGAMPFVHQTAHEATYQQLFSGLEQLQRGGLPLCVYYKPKGLTGENEAWLRQLVGSTANWERVVEHPLRLNLPNMLFVSISVGSSALLEGLSRGIPGLVVRDHPTFDYTPWSSEGFPIETTASALNVVQECGAADQLRKLSQVQLERYRHELLGI